MQAQLVQLVRKALLVHREIRVSKGFKVFKASKASKGLLAHKIYMFRPLILL
jgi:hypothetical protein